ncbi:MAG: 3-dehydroquinate synthase [Planctomycetes bacterium]|nr:3-dehydroquinate synthase [Planctomycetota bacterium]
MQIELGDRSYEMQIGCCILKEMLCDVQGRAMFVVDDNVMPLLGDTLSVDDERSLMTMFASETNKMMGSVEKIWDAMLDAGHDRATTLVAVGGGIVGDVGGFAAATFMRGVPLIQVPTTLLAMVDASIGGKTGVNTTRTRSDGSEILGKNLAGAFWQPKKVIADVQMLQSLDARQLRCGLAECVKHAMLGNPALLAFIEANAESILDCELKVMEELVFRSASIKAKVVSRDEREGGERALLNLGHTFAHAMEPMPALGLLHGEAVSIGLVAAANCSEALGLVRDGFVDRTREVLSKLGLPVRMQTAIPTTECITMMQLDKKNRDGKMRLVLPEGDCGAVITEDVDLETISLALLAVGAC